MYDEANSILTYAFEMQQPVYIHVSDDDLEWYQENEVNIINELARVVCDNISIIQHCYQETDFNSSAGIITMEELHHIQGESINIKYAMRKKNMKYDCILQYKSVIPNSVPETISTSSFSLNPLFLSPKDRKVDNLTISAFES